MPLAGTYRPRHPEHTAFYQCLEDYSEEFKEAYPYFYEKDYGPWRPVVERTVERFLRHGFARLRCSDCRREQLLAFSCKTRCFCALQFQLTKCNSKPSGRSPVCGPTVDVTPCPERRKASTEGQVGNISYDTPH